jgi:hypothetical protein
MLASGAMPVSRRCTKVEKISEIFEGKQVSELATVSERYGEAVVDGGPATGKRTNRLTKGPFSSVGSHRLNPIG